MASGLSMGPEREEGRDKVPIIQSTLHSPLEI